MKAVINYITEGIYERVTNMQMFEEMKKIVRFTQIC